MSAELRAAGRTARLRLGIYHDETKRLYGTVMKREERQAVTRDALPVSFIEILDRMTSGEDVVDVDEDGVAPAGNIAVLRVYRRLQNIVDYRAAIQGWFASVAPGGHLVIVVPHAFLYERQITLPSPWNRRARRLYTPASLMAEVEEALPPNSYRVRWLGDADRDYAYQDTPDQEPTSESDVVAVLERITLPPWDLDALKATVVLPALTTTNFAFEPARTREEMVVQKSARRILIMKLDHLGDFIMGLPALRRARRFFADATIDLVVGAWNADMAREAGVADRVIAFNAFPRNSTEEEPNVEATLGSFRSLVSDEYDLAIDLRTDIDTRVLLRSVKAPLKAGIGTRSRFPFLDIALPLDSTRNAAENAREDRISHDGFISQGSVQRRHFSLRSSKDEVERDYAIVWGPYLDLAPGDYIFDFYLDLDEDRADGLLRLDIALDRGDRVAELYVSGPATFQLAFRIDKPATTFEARIWTVEGHPSISFNFYGGRLLRRAPSNVLHQSEYALLLIEHVKMRMMDLGSLADVTRE